MLAEEDVNIAIGAAGRVLWHLGDQLGSTRDLVDNLGALATHYKFDSFGALKSGDTTKTRYLYTNQEYDVDTGNFLYNERWYDPILARFLSEDPRRDSTNWYAYVRNSSTNFVDPTGEVPSIPIPAPPPEYPRPPVYRPLKPNWDQGYGPLYHELHAVVIKFDAPGKTKAEIEDEAMDRLFGFSLFNGRNNKTANATPKEDIVYFQLLGGWGLQEFGSAHVIGNDSPFAVRVTRSGNEVSAVTLDNHQLVGVRKWRADVHGPIGKCGTFVVKFETEAYFRARNASNYSALSLVATGVQLKVWQSYLENIVDAYKSEYGAKVVFDRYIGGVRADLGALAKDPWGPPDQHIPPPIPTPDPPTRKWPPY